MNNYPGKLIVLYGINNLGKTTQAKLLVDKLKEEGYQAEYLKFPLYDLKPSGEILNDYLREGNFYNLDAKEAQLMYALNRTQYQEKLIKKLEAGIMIVAEDYKGTGIAWGLAAGISEMFLKSINSHLIEEDLVFLFDGERFLKAVEKSHRHENNDDLTNKARWSHLKLKDDYNWIKINANLKIQDIQETIWTNTFNFLNNKEKISQNNKTTYNYSGFSTLGDIINVNHKDISDKIKELENNKIEEIKTLAQPKPEPEEIILKRDPSPAEIVLKEELFNNKEKLEKIVTTNVTKKPEKVIKIEKIAKNAKLPIRAHASDAGLDLFSIDYYSITPYGQALVQTGIKIEIPENHAGLIWDKSGLATQGITTMGGVIDSGYRGEIKVLIKNLSEDDFNIVPGQKIAQIIIQEISNIKIVEKNLKNNTDRGEEGFGSSGEF